MLYLDFSYNWNCKLLNTSFSTLRLWSDEKYRKGDAYRVRLQSGTDHLELGNARLVQRTPLKLGDLTDNMSFIDTGYNAAETRAIICRMYKAKFEKEGNDMKIGFYIFKWESRAPGYFEKLAKSIITPYDKILETEATVAIEPQQQLNLSI